jgi:hypothetical protein
VDSSHIELNGSTIASIKVEASVVTLHFSPAMIIKTMTGSKERTLWRQEGDLVIEGVDANKGLPTGPAVCLGGDIDENVYTYRDMIPVPFDSRGHIRCQLRLDGVSEPLEVSGTQVSLILEDVPKYIRHIKSGETA